MYLTRLVLSVSGVPLLGGCMIVGGLRHTGDRGWMDRPGDTVTNDTQPLMESAQDEPSDGVPCRCS